jgi:hypothetical protein
MEEKNMTYLDILKEDESLHYFFKNNDYRMKALDIYLKRYPFFIEYDEITNESWHLYRKAICDFQCGNISEEDLLSKKNEHIKLKEKSLDIYKRLFSKVVWTLTCLSSGNNTNNLNDIDFWECTYRDFLSFNEK